MAGVSEIYRQSEENAEALREFFTKKKSPTPEQLIEKFVALCRTVKWKAKER